MTQQTTIPRHYEYLMAQVPENLREAVAEVWSWLRHLCVTEIPHEGNVDVAVPEPPFPGMDRTDEVRLTIYPQGKFGGRHLTVRVTPRSVRLIELKGVGGSDWLTAPVVIKALRYALADLGRWRLFQEVLDEVGRERIDWESDYRDNDKLIAAIRTAVERFRERHGPENTGTYVWTAMVKWANAGLLDWCVVPVMMGISSNCPY